MNNMNYYTHREYSDYLGEYTAMRVSAMSIDRNISERTKHSIEREIHNNLCQRPVPSRREIFVVYVELQNMITRSIVTETEAKEIGVKEISNGIIEQIETKNIKLLLT